MKVAIWGSYNYGNYGDDLMAIQFANELKRMGVEPWVYRLDDSLAKKYDIQSAKSIDELLENASFGIIGGGGLLVGKSTTKSTKSRQKADLENDFRELHLASCDRDCQIYPISVGGDGRGANTPLAPWKETFWKGASCGKSTVRLKEDIALIEKLEKDAIHYPDVLLATSDVWNIVSTPNFDGTLNVGINIGKSKINRVLALYLSLIAPLKKNIVFHFIRTHLPNYSVDYELMPKINSPYIKHHVYTDPKATIEFLANLDLLVSSKLHLGLTALAIKTPFYSYEGQGKTRTFLQSIDADFAYCNSDRLFQLVKIITNADRIKNARNQFDFTKLDKLRTESKGHINFLADLVNDHRSQT